MSLRDLRNIIEQRKGQRDRIIAEKDRERKAGMAARREARQLEQALAIVREVGLKTQEQLQYSIGEITTLALNAVFDDPYRLVVEFVQRRGRTECDLFFERDGERISPLEASGGGAVDVASFALRVASWYIKTPKTRPVLILDEPFRYLSANYRHKASEMLKEISSRLGVQIIMVTHAEELVDNADNVLRVKKSHGETHVGDQKEG